MKTIKHLNAGDALVAALTLSEKQFDCILVRDFWSYESDKFILVSPTGASLSIWAHHWVLDQEKNPSSLRDDVANIISRYDSAAPAAPNAEYNANSFWGRGRSVKVSKSEMSSWKIIAKMAKGQSFKSIPA